MRRGWEGRCSEGVCVCGRRGRLWMCVVGGIGRCEEGLGREV